MEYISPSVTDVLGYTPEEFYADPALGLKIVHPDDQQKLEKMMRGEGTAGNRGKISQSGRAQQRYTLGG
jgi:hypothetical protein